MAKPMTLKTAFRLARERWGDKYGWVEARPGKCYVGRVELGMFAVVKGSGATFEEAFERAGVKIPVR
jgi:hypothetical protein